MERVARFVVKYRYIFALLVLAGVIASFFTMSLVEIEDSVAEYLPDETNTKKALKIMADEFVTYGSTTIMLKDISVEEARAVKSKIESIDGVKEVAFEGNDKDYRDNRALITVTFKGGAKDDVSVKAYDSMLENLSDYSVVVPTPLYNDIAGRLAKDIVLVLGLCSIIIMIILVITSRSYAEVIVFPIVFVIAAIINMGTNFWFGKISFVSNTVCVILQLALAIDYSIILCHRFNDEKKLNSTASEAMVKALSKSIPEILSSCLTTVSGLLALVTMQLKLGQDLGLVLAKSILWSIVIVIFFMPTLLLWVTKLMDKSEHKSFVPEFKGWTRGVIKSRKVLPIVFLCFVLIFGITSVKIDYAYSLDNIDTYKPTDVQIAIDERTETFGNDNMLVVLVPKTDYSNEQKIVSRLKMYDKVGDIVALSNIEYKGTYLTHYVTADEFAGLTGLDSNICKILYIAYDNLTSAHLREGKAPFIDMALFAVDYAESHGVPLEGMGNATSLLKDAKDQLIGTHYTRMLVKIDYPIDGDEVFKFTDSLEADLKRIDGGIIFAGETMSAHDLAHSFETDMFLISLLTMAFIYVILLFTFKSWGLPLALVAVIEGAILINFGIIPLLGDNFYFFVYLIVSAIQMGATIDYAIIVTNHYREERLRKPKDVAIYDAMSASFPAIITSGSIMVIAPLFVGIFISDPLVSSLGYCLSRGSFISILCVLTVLPQLLYTFENMFLKTTFRWGKNGHKLQFVNDIPPVNSELESKNVTFDTQDADSVRVSNEDENASYIIDNTSSLVESSTDECMDDNLTEKDDNAIVTIENNSDEIGEVGMNDDENSRA